MPLVSVIIPVYNTEKYLPECLNSVLSQTLRDIEVICIDDASPDNCGKILDEYAQRDSRVKVIHLPENHRQGYGRNRGIERSSGEYLYFLDSDDMIEPHALEELCKSAKEEDADAVFFDARTVYDDEKLREVYMPPFQDRRGQYPRHAVKGTELLDAFQKQLEWTCYPQRIFWRSQFIKEEGILNPEGSEHEDEFFAFAGIMAARRALYLPKQYFILRIRPNSVMTSKPAPKNFHGYLINFYRMCRFVNERGLHTYGSEMCIGHMYERAYSLYAQLPEEELRAYCSQRAQDRVLYECFDAHIRAKSFVERIDPQILEQIRSHKRLYIYGAGIVGRRFAGKIFAQSDICLEGFLVTKKDGSAGIVCGRPVKEFSEVDLTDEDFVIVAMREGLLSEIEPLLAEKGVHWSYCRRRS